MNRAMPYLISVSLFLWLAGAPCVADDASTDDRLGVWRAEEKPGSWLRVEPGRVQRLRDGELTSFLARHEPGRVVLNFSGMLFTWKIEAGEDELRVAGDDGIAATFRRAKAAPPGFEVEPLEIPGRRRIPKGLVRKIGSELRERGRRDQEVREGRIDEREMRKVDAGNTEYIRKTVAKVGWIDAERFGDEAANAALMIVLHSGDLPLMLAARSALEREVKRKALADGESYALLFDRTRMHLGHRQRYGTQVVVDEQGRSVVFPLEEPERVDRLRKELGMTSLSESLAMQKRWTGSDIPIQQF